MKTKEQDIIETAVRLFSEKGYTATSVDEIAKESGIAKASFYKFFQGKEDVLIATVLEHGRIISEQIERLYAATDQSPDQRLNGFIQLHLQNICESKVHSIIMSLHDKSILQNEKLLRACLQVEYEINQWCADCLSEIYGEEVRAIAYDITFIVRSLLMQYMFLPVIGLQPQISIVQLGTFLTGLIDQLIKSMLASHYTPIWDWQKIDMSPSNVEKSPVFQGIMIHKLLLGMKRTIHLMEVSESEKTELWQVLLTLEQEITGAQHRNGIIQALLNFLITHAELASHGEQLKQLLQRNSLTADTSFKKEDGSL